MIDRSIMQQHKNVSASSTGCDAMWLLGAWHGDINALLTVRRDLSLSNAPVAVVRPRTGVCKS
jgi:hypothetical protein